MRHSGCKLTMARCGAVLTCILVALAAAAAEPAALKVRDGLEVEDLGVPIRRREVWTSDVYRDPDGVYHFFAQVLAFNGFEDDPPSQFLDFNLETGKVQSIQPGKVNGMGKVWAHANGKVYVAGTRPSSLIEFDPRTGEGRLIGLLTKHFYHAVHAIDADPDGALYFGHYGRHASRYDPKTGEIKDFGPMDGEGETYVYTIASDGRYIYCGMSRDWYLVIYDMQTGKFTTYRDAKGNVTRDKNGHIMFADVKMLKDGRVLTPAEAAEEKKKPAAFSPNSALRLVLAEEKYGYEFDVSDLNPTEWNNARVVLRWRKKGTEEWSSAAYEGVDIAPNPPAIMAATEDGKLIGMGGHYGPLFLFDPATAKTEFIGMSPCSINAFLAKKDTVHFVGYSSAWWIWDRTKPWTMRDKRAGYVKGVAPNPVNITGAGKWPSRIVEGVDGTLYNGGNYGRHIFGGEVVYYNPTTKERVTLRELMEPYTVTDLRALDGGRRIVWTAVTRDEAKTPTLFVFDAVAKKLVRQAKFPLAAGGPGAIMPAGGSAILGVSRIERKDEKAGESVFSTHVYKLDTDTAAVLFERDLPGRPFCGPRGSDYDGVDSELSVGPDGCGWFFIEKDLVRVHPDGAIEKVKAMPHGARLVWMGDDLYLYNGGRQWYGGFASIWRVKNVFGRK